MKEALKALLMSDLENLIPIGSSTAHLFEFTYNPDTLKILSLNSRLMEKEKYLKAYSKSDSHSIEGIINFSEGRIEYAWFPGSYGTGSKEIEKNIDWYRSKDLWLYYRCLDAVFSLKYYENIEQ